MAPSAASQGAVAQGVEAPGVAVPSGGGLRVVLSEAQNAE